jgi:DnaJ-class molecular chaperone
MEELLIICPTCSGTGKRVDKGHGPKWCPDCTGTGRQPTEEGLEVLDFLTWWLLVQKKADDE